MIWTIFRLGWLHLKRDRVALLLTFALPIVFFSIFAAVFSELDTEHLQKLEVALVLEDDGPIGERFGILLDQEPALLVHRLDTASASAARQLAIKQIRERQVDVGIVVPRGFAEELSDSSGESRPVQVLTDSSNPVVGEMAAGILNAVTIRLTFEQLGLVEEASGPESVESPFSIEIEDVLGNESDKPAVAFFSAGIGVMFLLFAVSGRSGILIDEKESGVLRRILTSRLGLGQLLLGHWLFLAVLGFAQVSVMFLWGWAAFGLDLWTADHLLGFLVMTTAAAAAAAAFGLFLASLCRTRIQLAGVSAVVILVMSALGGSMFPRYLMPEGLKKLGLMTFNAWAIDGYQKVFWYETGIGDLKPQLMVLVLATLVLLLATRMLAAKLVRDD